MVTGGCHAEGLPRKFEAHGLRDSDKVWAEESWGGVLRAFLGQARARTGCRWGCEYVYRRRQRQTTRVGLVRGAAGDEAADQLADKRARHALRQCHVRRPSKRQRTEWELRIQPTLPGSGFLGTEQYFQVIRLCDWQNVDCQSELVCSRVPCFPRILSQIIKQ